MMQFVKPGPAVTKANAFSPLLDVALNASAAITATTSCTTGIKVKRVDALSARCIMFPPPTEKQVVYPARISSEMKKSEYFNRGPFWTIGYSNPFDIELMTLPSCTW